MNFKLEQLHSARRLLGALRRVRLSEERQIDLIGRLEVLTVAVGLRAVAAFGFNEHEWPAAEVEALLESQGLRCVTTGDIRPTPAESPNELPAGLDEVFDRVDGELADPETLLWVYSDGNQVPEIEAVSALLCRAANARPGRGKVSFQEGDHCCGRN